MEKKGTMIEWQALKNSYVFVLAGGPTDEPIAHDGPFLMNTQEEKRSGRPLPVLTPPGSA